MRRALALSVALLFLLLSTLAFATPRGQVFLSPNGPIELAPVEGRYAAGFFIENIGDAPLSISRVAVHTDMDDPRVPAKVTVKPERPAPLVLASHDRVRVEVAWAPDATTRQRQAFGHVVVTSTDESTGEVAMGFHAQQPTAVARPLSLIVLVPLLFAVAMMIAHALGRAPLSLRPLTIGVTAFQSLASLWAWHAFDPAISRADGNDGLQFVEHTSWIHSVRAEWFVGLDGTNVSAMVAVCLVGLAACAWTPTPTKDAVVFDALLLVIVSSGVGALVAQDALLWLGFVALACVAVLVALSHFSDDAGAARLTAPFFAVGFAALALAVMSLHDESGKTFLVGGESARATWSLPELARVSFVLKTTKLFGLPLVAGAWSLGFVGALVFAGAFPFHSWLPRALASAPAALGAVLIASLGSVGLHALVRFAALLPEGARWAATTTLVLGLLGATYAALCALVQRDLARTLGFAMVAQSCLVLVALGSLTHQGIAGALLALPSRALAGALLALACGALHGRIRTRDVLRVSGLAKEAPWLTAAIVAGALSAMAAPGTSAGWLPIMSTFGALPRGVGASLGVVVATAILAVALGRAAVRLASGSLRRELATSPLLEPFGGRVPDLDAKGTLSALALALLLLIFGVHPAPLVTMSHVSVNELGAVLNPPGPGEIARR